MNAEAESRAAEAVHTSFIGEAAALKPGNVSRYVAGHDMNYEDFVRSAEVATPVLCRRDRPVGERILAAVQATRQAVGCNTNLGMLLLFAPLLRAREVCGEGETLESALRRVLDGLDRDDARAVYASIRLARPGGLGQAARYDVNSEPEVGLLAAMDAARERDLIALQYCNGFREIFHNGLIFIRKYKKQWKNLEWATVGCYLSFMALFPDSHVARKHGPQVAEETRRRSEDLRQCLDNNDNPEDMKTVLLDYDRELKDANINPGTSADLTAASLLLYHLGA